MKEIREWFDEMTTEEKRNTIGEAIAWLSLVVICFMMSIICA